MKTRILTAAFLIPLLIILLVSPNYVISAAVAVVSLIGLYELFKTTGILNKKGLAAVGFLAGLVTSLAIYIPSSWYMPCFFVFLLLMFFIMLKNHTSVYVSDAALTLFGVAYIPLLLSTLTLTAHLENGRFALYAIFIGAFATDTFAYFTGVFLGKHKLCPEISPKKTIEGSIGGTLGCVLLLLLYGFLLNNYFSQSISYLKLGILGILIAIISQVGDLTASIIKRKFGVKDYGKLFPGHGGILDRLDSIITTAPLVYCFVTMIGF